MRAPERLLAVLGLSLVVACSGSGPRSAAPEGSAEGSAEGSQAVASASDAAPASANPDIEEVGPMTSETRKVSEYNELTPAEARVIEEAGTERAFTGEYTDNKAAGTYICRRCNAPLYRSQDKFDSRCGWPSFDDELEGRVVRRPDPDGRRVEIVCANCDGHLGHVFLGEGFTQKDTRHCVNSISMRFVPAGEELPPTLVLESGS